MSDAWRTSGRRERGREKTDRRTGHPEKDGGGGGERERERERESREIDVQERRSS